MNLLTFARKTAPIAFYAIPAVFLYGTAASFVDSEPAIAFATLFAGTSLFIGFLLGCALHRQRLVNEKLKNYIGGMFFNSSTHGWPTPTEAVGREYVNYVNEHPIEVWE